MAKIIYKNHLPGPVYIAESTKSRKVAGRKMVNEAEGSDDVEDGSDPKYVGSAYYGSDFRGLSDSIETNDWSEFQSWVHEQAMNGSYLDLTNNEDDTCLQLTPDEYEEMCGEGEGLRPDMMKPCGKVEESEVTEGIKDTCKKFGKRMANVAMNVAGGTLGTIAGGVAGATAGLNPFTTGAAAFGGGVLGHKIAQQFNYKVESANEAEGDVPVGIVAIYDSPDYWDRYTVVYGKPYDKNGAEFYECLGLSDNCDSSQGFSQWSECMNGDHLGKKVEFSELPEVVQNHIKRRLAEGENVTEGKNDNEKIEQEFKEFVAGREPCFEFENGNYIYFQYNKETNTLDYGSVTNTGLLKDGSMEYDQSESMQTNIENLYSELEAKYGQDTNEAVNEDTGVRQATNKLIDMLDDGVLDDHTVAVACLDYMSEDDVKDMAESNELYDEDEDTTDKSDTRHVTNYLLGLAEDGVLTYRQIVDAAVRYMSEDDVKDMAESNEFFSSDDDENDDENDED